MDGSQSSIGAPNGKPIVRGKQLVDQNSAETAASGVLRVPGDDQAHHEHHKWVGEEQVNHAAGLGPHSPPDGYTCTGEGHMLQVVHEVSVDGDSSVVRLLPQCKCLPDGLKP